MVEPLQYGNLFLVGDAAHIVPPTGAKGLNLAVSDVHYLSEGLIAFYRGEGDNKLFNYSKTALNRIWKAVRFSWWMTTLMHEFPETKEFDRKIKISELEHLSQSNFAQAHFAENYVGIPL